MNQKTYLSVSAIIFGIIAVLHALRAAYGWEASIAGWALPTWASVVALLVAGYLAYQGYRLSK